MIECALKITGPYWVVRKEFHKGTAITEDEAVLYLPSPSEEDQVTAIEKTGLIMARSIVFHGWIHVWVAPTPTHTYAEQGLALWC